MPQAMPDHVESVKYYTTLLAKARATLDGTAGDPTAALSIDGSSYTFNSPAELMDFVTRLELKLSNLTKRYEKEKFLDFNQVY